MIIFDISSKKHISKYSDQNINLFIEIFFESFFDIQLKDDLIITFIHNYVGNMNNYNIEQILKNNCNNKTVKELENKYKNLFNSIEFIRKNHVIILDNLDNFVIKKDMVSLILYNTVCNIQIVY
jgi:hypothetical protein